MDISRRSFMRASAASAAGAAMPGSAALLQQPGRIFTPEMFGAKGDGVTNDTRALAALAAAVNINGGGIVEFRRTTYIVGEQFQSGRAGAFYSFAPAKILEFAGCRKPVIIRGNDARLRCADGLRYGTFDPVTGRPTRNPMPFAGSQVATPYNCMLQVKNCSGPIEISDLELDGNVARLRIGGEYGDQGRQIPGLGLGLFDNRGSEFIHDIKTHHHAQDGLYIDGLDEVMRPAPRRLIRRLHSEYNGRQGCSIIGGRGYAFEDCKFNRTGRSAVASAPGAGVDIEAEGGKKNRDFTFTNCEFADNYGCGFLADTGDSEGATLTGCTFIGTSAWSAWPNKPRFRFRGCTFVGAIVRAFGDPDPTRAAQFHDCTFRDDPRLSPTRKVYLGGGKPDGTIADLSDTRNVLFSRCSFLLTHGGVLPWSVHVIYADCRMEQRSGSRAYPRGRFLGRNTITGHVDLYSSNVVGEVVVNGDRIVRRQL
jgi:hypothetical protein